MLVKELITILLEFPMESPVIALSDKDDLQGFFGKKVPNLKIGTIEGTENKENEKARANIVVLISEEENDDEKPSPAREDGPIEVREEGNQ